MPAVYLLTMQQAAVILNVSRARVYELRRLGLLPCVQIGRQLRVEAGVLRAWIEQGGRGLTLVADPKGKEVDPPCQTGRIGYRQRARRGSG
jgi:excisionase family DNA binding protein